MRVPSGRKFARQIRWRDRRCEPEVIPLRRSASAERHFLILFETAEEREQAAAEQGGTEAESEERQIKHLSQELAAARDYLQSVIEEYEATNEELQSASEEAQSSNEELQSINEELETSKEELESSNEELITLNEELNNRNAELDGSTATSSTCSAASRCRS